MARKRFGQHFLHERGVIDRILAAVAPAASDRIVEIGPGEGALTDPLLSMLEHLTVIEIDRDLIAQLEARGAHGAPLDVVAGDALRVDYAALAARLGGPLRLVGNLPYNVASPLMIMLLGTDMPVVDMHFMIQKEVADRLTAAPGSRAYGRLSVSASARAETRLLFNVGPGAFRPPPKVDSSVVRIRPRAPDYEIADKAWFDRIVAAAFNQRRKTLRNALRHYLDAADFTACDIDPGDRAEQLAPADFARLANRAAAERSDSHGR